MLLSRFRPPEQQHEMRTDCFWSLQQFVTETVAAQQKEELVGQQDAAKQLQEASPERQQQEADAERQLQEADAERQLQEETNRRVTALLLREVCRAA
eukprot:3508941-Amphidinium_carterae.1